MTKRVSLPVTIGNGLTFLALAFTPGHAATSDAITMNGYTIPKQPAKWTGSEAVFKGKKGTAPVTVYCASPRTQDDTRQPTSTMNRMTVETGTNIFYYETDPSGTTSITESKPGVGRSYTMTQNGAVHGTFGRPQLMPNGATVLSETYPARTSPYTESTFQQVRTDVNELCQALLHTRPAATYTHQPSGQVVAPAMPPGQHSAWTATPHVIPSVSDPVTAKDLITPAMRAAMDKASHPASTTTSAYTAPIVDRQRGIADMRARNPLWKNVPYAGLTRAERIKLLKQKKQETIRAIHNTSAARKKAVQERRAKYPVPAAASPAP